MKGYQEVREKGPGGEGLKGIAELEYQKRKGMLRLVQRFLNAMT